MRTSVIVKEALDFDVAEYVAEARRTGRLRLDPALRGRMADLYVDLAGVLDEGEGPVKPGERRSLRFAELVLQSEWKLADPSGTSTAADDPIRLVGGPRGKRYQPYGNVRLLNHVLGARRHSSDACIEEGCRRAVRFLVESWTAFERRSAEGREPWGGEDPPGAAEAVERLDRLAGLAGRTASWPSAVPAGGVPPARWDAYLGARGEGAVLEYLINLPQTRKHEENIFLRAIHLTEATTSGILARTLAAKYWLEFGRCGEAAWCLCRATELAELQYDVMLVLRRTMAVDGFLGFREETGNASAIQMVSAQLLQVHLLGVHPEKVEALGGVEETAFLLGHLNEGFRPLRALLHDLPDGERAAPVLHAARALDDTLFRWRRLHLGLAHRYLSKETKGSGGTSGAPYLAGFYHDRMFDADGVLFPHPEPVSTPFARHRAVARPAFSPLN